MQCAAHPPAIPYKVLIPSRCEHGPTRVGIAATSYSHLVHLLRHKYKVSGSFCLQQEDGTIVCDEDYFKLLEPRTTLKVLMLPSPPRRPHPQPQNTSVVSGYSTQRHAFLPPLIPLHHPRSQCKLKLICYVD